MKKFFVFMALNLLSLNTFGFLPFMRSKPKLSDKGFAEKTFSESLKNSIASPLIGRVANCYTNILDRKGWNFPNIYLGKDKSRFVSIRELEVTRIGVLEETGRFVGIVHNDIDLYNSFVDRSRNHYNALVIDSDRNTTQQVLTKEQAETYVSRFITKYAPTALDKLLESVKNSIDRIAKSENGFNYNDTKSYTDTSDGYIITTKNISETVETKISVNFNKLESLIDSCKELNSELDSFLTEYENKVIQLKEHYEEVSTK